MISQTDFQPLSIAKITIFHQQTRFYRQIYHSVKVHANEEVPCINYDLLIRYVTVPVSVDSQTYLQYFVLNISHQLVMFKRKR